MATFGNVFAGTETINETGGTWRINAGGAWPLSEAGTVSTITALLQATSTTGNCKAMIYDDNGTNGDPGTLLGVSGIIAITTTKGSFVFTFSPGISLAIGSYWLAVVSDGTDIKFFLDSGGTNEWRSNNVETNYTNPPSNPTKFSIDGNYEFCYYATYTPTPSGSRRRRMLVGG